MDTRKEFDVNVWKYRDFPSLTDMARAKGEMRNRGYDISNNGILNKCVSKNFYRDSKFSVFLEYVDKMMIHFINCIKRIQFSKNYVIKENDYSINI